MLGEGQVSVNGFVLGSDTDYELKAFNPWTRDTRHNTQQRPRNHGSWSGDEFLDSVTIPLRIKVNYPAEDHAGWLSRHRALCQAFRPQSTDVELRYRLRGDPVEYLMFGRPRLVDPQIRHLGNGSTFTAAAFVALDPLTYSAAEHDLVLGLPTTSGGLTEPYTVPYSIDSTSASGRGPVSNAGTEPAPLFLRIDAGAAPLTNPRVFVQAGTEPSQLLHCSLVIGAGQWLTLDTARHTARLNGTSTRRGLIFGTWPLVPAAVDEVPVAATLGFDADVYSATASVKAVWRDTWI